MRLAWTRIRPGHISGNPRESLSKAVLDYAASVIFGGHVSPGGLSTIYITGRVPPEHMSGPYGLPENFSAIGNGFRTPAQWLELRQQEQAAAGFIPSARPLPGSNGEEQARGKPALPPAGFGELLQEARAGLEALRGSDNPKAGGSLMPGRLINDQLVEWGQPAGAPALPVAEPAGKPVYRADAGQPSYTGAAAAQLERHEQPLQGAGGLAEEGAAAALTGLLGQTGQVLAEEAAAGLAQVAYNRAITIALLELEKG
jgi:hypothetical protein